MDGAGRVGLRPQLAAAVLTATALLAFARRPEAAGAPGAPARGGQGGPVIAATSFSVDPLTIELSGAPGDIVPFQLRIRSEGGRRRIETRAVTYEQNMEGGIYPSDTAVPPGWVEIDEGCRSVEPEPGRPAVVRGRAFIEHRGPAFRLFGIRLSEAPAEGSANVAAPGKATGVVRINVSFVARIEVRVERTIEARASELHVRRADFVERAGRVAVRAALENPTDRSIEFEASCQLVRADTGKRVGPSFALVLPVNATKVGPARVASRILPSTEVALEDLVPSALPPGRYRITVTIAAGRERVFGEFPTDVEEGRFPAQEFTLGRGVGPVLVSPPQVELSLRRGAPRMVPIAFENFGAAAASVRVSVDEPAPDWLVLAPTTFDLAAERSRRVPVLLRAPKVLSEARYATIRVVVETPEGRSHEARVPVALVPAAALAPRLAVHGLEPDPAGDGFVLRVANEGTLHARLAASLTVSDAGGKSVAEASAGYGAWLLPGAEETLRFRLPQTLGPGRYRVLARVGAGDGNSQVETAIEWEQ